MPRRENGFGEFIASLPWKVGVTIGALVFVAGLLVARVDIGGGLHLERMISLCLKLLSGGILISAGVSFFRQKTAGKVFDEAKSSKAIGNLNWAQFEELIGEYYRRSGYVVTQLGGASPDGGIDLIAKKDGKKLVIQCKHWKAYKVDVKIVREVYGVMVDQAASGAVIITSGDFTQPAAEFAQGRPIELIDGRHLPALLEEARNTAVNPPLSHQRRAELIPTEPPPLCPHCKQNAVLRTAGRGPNPGRKFWGCPNYPRCTFTADFR